MNPWTPRLISLECALHVTLRAHIDGNHLDPGGFGSGARHPQDARDGWVISFRDEASASESWHDRLEQLHSMRDDLFRIAREACDGPTRAIQGCRELCADRIADHHGRNRRLVTAAIVTTQTSPRKLFPRRAKEGPIGKGS
jgi:hypothetical protein